MDFWIFVFDGPGGRGGLRESWQSKPHLQKRRFRRVLADFRCFGLALCGADEGQRGAARGRGRSASGSRSAAAGPRRRHVVTRWSKLRAAARPQWQQRSSRGRRSVALWLWEAAQAYPRREAISAASRASMACHAGERGRAEASGQDEAQRARRRREARPPTIRGAHPRATSPAGRRSRCATAKGRGGCCCCRCCRCCSYRCCHRCCRCCRCCCCYRCRRRRCQSSWPAFHHIVH